MRTHDSLRPHMAGLAIDFDLDNLHRNRLSAERVRDAAPCQDISIATRLRRWTRIPAVLFSGGFENGDRTHAPESAVIGRASLQQLQAEFQRISFGCRRNFV